MSLLLNDVMFKIVFGSESSAPILRALINGLLGFSGPHRIVELELLNPTLPKASISDRGAVLDVRARDSQDRLYNIEVQLANHRAYAERVIYYATRLFTTQLEPGEPYDRLAKTIGISLLDFALFPNIERLHTTFRFHENELKFELSDVLELHFIELSKFRADKPRALRTPFEKWLHVLKFADLYNPEEVKLPKALIAEEGIEMALNYMREASASKQVKLMMLDRDIAMSDQATRLKEALEEGLQQGLEQGREQGLEQGLEQGREQGRLALVEAAKRLIADGMSREKALKMTGLQTKDLDEANGA